MIELINQLYYTKNAFKKADIAIELEKEVKTLYSHARDIRLEDGEDHDNQYHLDCIINGLGRDL